MMQMIYFSLAAHILALVDDMVEIRNTDKILFSRGDFKNKAVCETCPVFVCYEISFSLLFFVVIWQGEKEAWNS